MAVCRSSARLSGSSPLALPRPRFGIFGRICSDRLRNFGTSAPEILSATGARDSFHDAALDDVHQREVACRPGKQRPAGVAEATQEEGVAERSITRCRPSFRWTASTPEIQTRAASRFRSASLRSSPFEGPSSSSGGRSR